MSTMMTRYSENLDNNRMVTIEAYRLQLKSRNIINVNNQKYTYTIGTIYMEIFSECEKLGDYFVNVSDARMGTRIKYNA